MSCGGALSNGCVRVCSTSGYITSGLRGPSPQALTLGLSPDASGAPKRGMQTGSEAFSELPVALGFGPVTGTTLKTALCHIRTLVVRRINKGTFFAALLCVLWWGALERLWLRVAQFVRVCSTTEYITSGLRGPSPQALTLFGWGWVYRPTPQAPRKGECRRCPRHFWNCLSRWASALRQDPP